MRNEIEKVIAEWWTSIIDDTVKSKCKWYRAYPSDIAKLKQELSKVAIPKDVLRDVIKRHKVIEHDFQTGEIEFSMTGELVPVEVIEDLIGKDAEEVKEE